jgi:hypothetical protein
MGAEDVLFTPSTLMGGHAAPFHLSEGHRVRGRLQCLLWPETTDLLLAAGLERADGLIPTHCLDWYAPSGSRRFLGVLAESVELAAQASGDCMLSLNLIGRSEGDNPSLAASDFDYAGVSPVPFGFHGATVSIDAAGLSDVEEFRLTISNGLEVGPLRHRAATFIAPGKREISVELTKLASDEGLAEAVQAGTELAFAAVLSHPAGHSMTLSLPRLRAASSLALPRPDELVRETVLLRAAAPAGGEEIAWEINLV